jgi:FkbM family methyltransferase
MTLVVDLLSKAAFEWPCDTIKGRILRRSLRAVPKSLTVSVHAGPAKGAKWSAGAGPADFWLGTYEVEKAELFTQYAKPGGTVYDIGANVGFYTLIASQLVGPTGQVIAFEPSPRNLHFLHHHLDLNQVSNVRILDLAVSNGEGTAQFLVGNDPRTSKMTSSGDIIVRTAALDHLAEHLPTPDLIEMDIEGAEYAALRGAEQLLRNANPVIFLSTHGAEVHQGCCDLLRSLGYALHPIGPRPIEEAEELYCLKEQ